MGQISEAEKFHTIIVGIGAMGSSALYHLAKQGVKVLGLESQSVVPHSVGSSHGLSRIIRLSYHEGEQYNPLLKRSYELWKELETQYGQQLYTKTGYMDISPGSSSGSDTYSMFQRSLAGAVKFGIPHEVLTAQQVHQRFPGFNLPPHFMALYQEDGGILAPEKCIAAHVTLATKYGAHVEYGATVRSWSVDESSGTVSVTTGEGAIYTADHVILTAGAWMTDLVPELKDLCVPQRQVVGWFDCDDAALFQTSCCPVFALADDRNYYYGFPAFEGMGFKLGKFLHLNQNGDARDTDWAVHEEDEEALRVGLRAYFPHANGRMAAAGVCLFTNTPDMNFIIDKHPNHPQVIVCSACSGHGFKMSSCIGEILAQMALRGSSSLDITAFTLDKQRITGASHQLLQHLTPSPS